MTDVKPWELVPDKTVSQLIFAYEMILTEMRTHARADRTIKEWVSRMDFERDEFVKSMLVRPAETLKISAHRLRNTREWAAARVGELSGAEVIVAACNEALRARGEQL